MTRERDPMDWWMGLICDIGQKSRNRWVRLGGVFVYLLIFILTLPVTMFLLMASLALMVWDETGEEPRP